MCAETLKKSKKNKESNSKAKKPLRDVFTAPKKQINE